MTLAALDYPCSECHAEPGDLCRDRVGRPTSHDVRLREAGDHDPGGNTAHDLTAWDRP